MHSDSWGKSNEFSYGVDSQQVDLFMYENPDFLSIFAAGNSGQVGSTQGASTVQAPATAKNCLSVGASLSVPRFASPGSLARDAQLVDMTLTYWQGGLGKNVTFRIAQANFGGELLDIPNNANVVIGSPLDLCTPAANPQMMAGSVVFGFRGTCTFAAKVRTAQDAGAVGVILVNNALDGYVIMHAEASVAREIEIAAGNIPFILGK